MIKFFQVQRFTETINLTAENNEHTNRDSDKIIYALDGADTVYNSADKVTVSGDSGSDLIINGQFFEKGGVNVELLGGENADTITNSGAYSKIDGGTGDDLIHNGYYYYAPWNAYYEGSGNDGEYNDSLGSAYTTIIGGAGNDSIYNRGDNVTINAGAGNNYIENYGKNVLVSVNGGIDTIKGDNITIAGSENNDTLTGSTGTQTFQYESGGGDDVIVNYSGEDIIQIASGKITDYSFDGGDLIFHIGDGSLTLKNMTNHAITVKDSSGKTSTQIYSNGYSPQQVIKNFVKSMANTALDTRLKLDEAIQLSSGFKSLQEVIDKMVADCRKAGNAETFLRDYCGIITDNDDRDAATGWDAGGLKIKTQSDLFPQFGNAVYPSSTTFKIRDLEITVPEKSTLSEKEQLVVKGFYSWWAKDAIKLIEDTYGLSFKGKSMKLSFFNDDTSFAWGYGGSNGVRLNLAYTSFDVSDKNGNRLGDYLFPHEMTHVLQGDFNIWSYMPNYMTEGMADLTGGNTRYMSELASDSSLLAKYLDVNNTFSEDVNVYAVGYMFWRYLMKQASDNYSSSGNYAFKNNSEIVGTESADLLTSNADKITIKGGAGKDTITAYGTNSKIYGDSGSDCILIGSTAKNLTVIGGKDNDTIRNEGINAKIYGGTGNDSIRSEGDKAKIYGGAGNDEIYNSGSKATISGGTGNDIISNYGESAEMYGGANDDKIYNYADKSTIYGGRGKDFIINGEYWEDEKGGDNVTITAGDSSDTITSHGENSVLNGGAGNDVIYNGYKYYEPWNAFYTDENLTGANSTITGGKGNDKISLASYSENVVINYSSGDGKDTVFGFDSNDTLQISGSYSTVKSGYDIIVKVGKGSITFKDYDGDNIFITSKSSANLSELVADNSIGEFEFENKTTEQENLITFSK